MTNPREPQFHVPLAAPTVTVLLPDDPQWDEEGLLPLSDAFKPLPVEVPEWTYIPIPNEVTVLRLYWGANQLIDTHESVDPLPHDFRQFKVPVSYLTEGLHQVWYELTTPNADVNESLRQPVTIDLAPPILGSNNGQLIFDTTTITEQYLIDNDDRVIAQVPAYLGLKPGDVITWYWNDDPFDVALGDVVGSQTLPRGESQPLSVEFSGDMIRARGDGERYAFYRLKDRAGNETNFSNPARMTVEAQPVGRELPSPTVAEATGTSTSSILDPYSARIGATVVIPDEAVFKPGDEVEVQWAAPGTYGAYVATEADASGKRFTVPAQYIPQHMGKNIEVYYRVTGNGPPDESDRHALTVQQLTGRWTTIQCTRPTISSGKLSLASVDSYATFRLSQWMFMAIDQRVTISLSATGTTRVVLDKHPVKQADIDAKGVSVDVLKTDLQSLPLGALNVQVKVSFDDGRTEVPFPTLNLQLVQ